MNTILLEVKNDKAYKVLQDLEEQDIIKVLNKNGKQKASSFRGRLNLTEEQYQDLQNHLVEIRNEWHDNI